MLSIIFGPKREKVAGGWEGLRNEGLHNLYAPPNITRLIKSRRMRWAGHVASIGEMRNEYHILVVKPERKRLLGRPRCKWKDNIRMDTREMGGRGTGFIWLRLRLVACSCEHDNGLLGSIKGGELLE